MSLARVGRPGVHGALSDELWEGYEVGFCEVSMEAKLEHFTWCEWFYEGSDFPALQIVTPDPTGRLPGESGFDGTYGDERQPLLGTWVPPARNFEPSVRVFAANPPGGPEALWSKKRGDDTYELISVSFEAYGVNIGDVVRCESDPRSGALVIQEVAEPSGRRTLRIIYEKADPVRREAVEDRLRSLGADVYVFGPTYVAIDVPAGADYGAVFDFLSGETSAMNLTFEEVWAYPLGHESEE